MKKILFIDAVVTPYMLSRYERWFAGTNHGVEAWFLAGSDRNRHWKDFPPVTVPWRVFPALTFRLQGKDTFSFFFAPSLLIELWRRRSEFSVVMLCGWDSPTYWLAAGMLRFLGRPYGVWSGSTKRERSWRRSLSLPLVKRIVQGASTYIAYGTDAQEYLEQLGAKPERIQKYYNDVESQHFQKGDRRLGRERLGIPLSVSVLLCVGQLIERKGMKELVAAFLKSNLASTEWHLVIIGSGSLEAELKKLSNGSSRVHLIPHQEYCDMPDFYAAADVCILPSREEVWGLVANEAMAAGKAAIFSSEAGCTADLCIPGKTGWRAHPDALSTVLTEVLQTEPEKLAMMGKAAQERLAALDRQNTKVVKAFYEKYVKAH